MGDDIVTLYVGAERKRFTVHKKLLCDGSPFFAKAFQGSFKEAKEGVMDLPEDDANTVAVMVDFLYRGSVQQTFHSDIEQNLTLLRSLYVLADKVDMKKLMDNTIDEIAWNLILPPNFRFDKQTIQQTYAQTHATSNLRRYCAALLLCTMVKKDLDSLWSEQASEISESHPEFCQDLVQLLLKYSKQIRESTKGNSAETVAEFGTCEFHSHGSEEECYLKATK